MTEEEPEGIRMATGGVPAQEWELPTGLILEKDSQYGVSLYVDYVRVKMLKGGRDIEISESMGKLLDYREMQDIEKQALEYEVQALLESEIIPEEEKDDEGKMVKLTDEERRSKAEELAEQSELEYGSEVLEQLKQDIDDEKIPYMFRKQVWHFWGEEDAQGPTRGEKPENEIAWLSTEEEEFLNTVENNHRRFVIEENEVPQTLRSFALAVREIMERLSRQDFIESFRKIIPVWSYMRLKYDLKKKGAKYRMTAEDFREAKERLELMRHWLRSHKLEMTDAARRMLDKNEAAGITPKAGKKGAKQLTVEMKKAKMKPRANPETYTEKLLEYYNSVGQDPEIPVDWLIAEGATPDQIWAAADELLKTGRIDPPDYWAITATLSGVDYHVVVPRGNPTANEELAGSKKSPFKTAREGLKEALKRMTSIEVVEYKPYEPPAPEPTTEESVESLEQTAKVLVEEEEGIEEGVKALEGLTEQTVKSEWTAMFDKERKEHPTLPEDVVKKIVDDHLTFKKGLSALAPEDEIEGRENPSVEDRAVKAFWEKRGILGPKAIPMDEQMPRRKGEPPQKAEQRRDEVKVYGEPGLADDPEVVAYYLWGNLIARLATNEQDHKTLSLSTAGFETNLTNQRLHSILSEGQKHHPILKRFSISKERHAIWLERIRTLKEPDPKKPWQTRKYDKICVISPTMYPLDEVKGKLPAYTTSIDLEATLKENLDALKQKISEMEIPIDTLEEVQTAIDAIEKDIAAYRAEKKDFDATPVQVAEWLGKRQRFEELLKQRDELMWRGNPESLYASRHKYRPPAQYTGPKAGGKYWVLRDLTSNMRIRQAVKFSEQLDRQLTAHGVDMTKTVDLALNGLTLDQALELGYGGKSSAEQWKEKLDESADALNEGDTAIIISTFWKEPKVRKSLKEGVQIILDKGARVLAVATPPSPARNIISDQKQFLDKLAELGVKVMITDLHEDDATNLADQMTSEILQNPKIPYTPPDAPDVEVKCPVTGKYTWSCNRCALFDGRSEQFIECKAKEGKRYYLARTGDKRGTVWDTYVLPRNQRKAGIETTAIGGD